jgi:predicted DNA-binding protein (UPF0251 family)
MSPRPKKYRKVDSPPIMRGYKPFGIPFSQSVSINLHYEEYEAIRLCDYNNLSQEESSVIMNISRPTFTRIYEQARKKIASAFIEGKALLIEGGDYEFDKLWFKCDDCYHLYHVEKYSLKCPECKSSNIHRISNTNESIKKDSIKIGGVKFCYCENCDTKVEHKAGIPCRKTECPNCGGLMIGGRH